MRLAATVLGMFVFDYEEVSEVRIQKFSSDGPITKKTTKTGRLVWSVGCWWIGRSGVRRHGCSLHFMCAAAASRDSTRRRSIAVMLLLALLRFRDSTAACMAWRTPAKVTWSIYDTLKYFLHTMEDY